MIDLRDLGYLRIHEVEKSSYVLTMGMRRGRRKFWLGLGNEIFLDCGYVVTMTFLYTIIILKVGPLSCNMFFLKIFYMVNTV